MTRRFALTLAALVTLAAAAPALAHPGHEHKKSWGPSRWRHRIT